MAYPQNQLVEKVVAAAKENPRVSADELAAQLGVHRHTLDRVLLAEGTSLARLKRSVIAERLDAHFREGGAESLKQVWSELGFDPLRRLRDTFAARRASRPASWAKLHEKRPKRFLTCSEVRGNAEPWRFLCLAE